MADNPHCGIFSNASSEKGKDDEHLFRDAEGAFFRFDFISGGDNCRYEGNEGKPTKDDYKKGVTHFTSVIILRSSFVIVTKVPFAFSFI